MQFWVIFHCTQCISKATLKLHESVCFTGNYRSKRKNTIQRITVFESKRSNEPTKFNKSSNPVIKEVRKWFLFIYLFIYYAFIHWE